MSPTTEASQFSQRLTRSLSRRLALSDLPIPSDTVQVSQPSKPKYSQPPSLTTLPVELKLIIINFLDQVEMDSLRAINKRSWELDEFTPDRSGRSKTKIGKPLRGLSVGVWSNAWVPTSADLRTPKLSSLKALGSVDRSFYHLCQPFIWELLDLQGATIPKLKRLLNDVLPLHRHHVRSLWWRASGNQLRDWEGVDYLTRGPLAREHWAEELRNALLLRILQVCPRLLQLDIDGDEKINGPSHLGAWGRKRGVKQTTGIFFEPIARLSGLTALTLTSPAHRPSFDESVVVSLVREMRELETFTCVGIRASPGLYVYPAPVSPLGTQLASLARLHTLSLTSVDCVNASWATLAWCGPVRSLSFNDCMHLLIDIFHALVHCFAKTLTQIQVGEFQMMEQSFFSLGQHTSPHITRPFVLPKLTVLTLPCTMTVSREFMRGFLGCQTLRKIQVGRRQTMNYPEFVSLLEREVMYEFQSEYDDETDYEEDLDEDFYSGPWYDEEEHHWEHGEHGVYCSIHHPNGISSDDLSL